MEKYNIFANDLQGGFRIFNLGITIDKTEEWVKAEVERLNSLDKEDVVYKYEEV